MHWFIIALFAPFLWSISNHIDKYLVEGYIQKVKLTSFIITGSIFVVLFLIGIVIFKPVVLHIRPDYAVYLMLSGVLFAVYLFPYYKALSLEEASIVVPMFQMIPIIGFVLAFFFLGERLTSIQILAGLIIISASVGLSLDLTHKVRLKSKVFFLMFFSSLLVSVGVLIYKFVALRTSYWTAIFWQQSGIVILAVGFLCSRSLRENFVNMVLRQGRKFILLESINEMISQGASLIFDYVYLLVPIALVQLVGSIQPLFVLVIGILASIFAPKFASENLNKKFLAQKIIFVGIILTGSYLLFAY